MWNRKETKRVRDDGGDRQKTISFITGPDSVPTHTRYAVISRV
jgi:hypothetical protein